MSIPDRKAIHQIWHLALESSRLFAVHELLNPHHRHQYDMSLKMTMIGFKSKIIKKQSISSLVSIGSLVRIHAVRPSMTLPTHVA